MPSPRPIRRRAFLRAAPSVLLLTTGCVSTGTTPRTTPPEDTPAGYWRWVQPLETTPPAEETGVAIRVAVTRPWVTAEDTARLTVELENEADDPREIGPVVGDPVFPVNRDGILLWDETGTTEPQPPDCIGTDGKADRPVGYSGGMRPPVELDAGETVTRTLIIADDANTNGCVPGGRYRFELGGVIRSQSGASSESDYEWGFTLEVHASE